MVGSSDFNRSGNACVRRRRDPHWLPHITQSVLYDQPVTVFAKNEAQTGLVLGLAQEIVYSRQIKVHLPGEFRFEFFDLKIDNDVAAQSQMIEKQIEKEVLVADFEVILTSNERETLPLGLFFSYPGDVRFLLPRTGLRRVEPLSEENLGLEKDEI